MTLHTHHSHYLLATTHHTLPYIPVARYHHLVDHCLALLGDLVSLIAFGLIQICVDGRNNIYVCAA